MHPERDVHIVEIGDDEQVLFLQLGFIAEIAGQVQDGNHRLPGLENPLHCRMGMGHCLHRLAEHDFVHLRDVNAVKAPGDRKLHDFDLIGTRFQQDFIFVNFICHSSLPFI